MAHLWIEELDGEWSAIRLASSRIDLADLGVGALRTRSGQLAAEASRAVLLRTDHADGGVWHLIAAPESDLWINGVPLIGGFHVLADRDEVRLDGVETFFFSAEELARVVPMPPQARPVNCPRCSQEIEPGSPAGQCPGCRLWYHQTDILPCWTYATTCALCPQPTALDAGFRWTPMEL